MDVYEMVQSTIIEKLNQGIIPWKKPWSKENFAISYVSRKPYSLLNQFLLGKSGEYMTFNQCNKLGGHIRKGAKSKIVVFWKMLEKYEKVEGEDEPVKKVIPMLRYYSVFHIDDCEGIKSKLTVTTDSLTDSNERADELINDYVTRENISVNFEGTEAYYVPTMDSITIPSKKFFDQSKLGEFYSTVFHEIVHSTGHEKRLNRNIKNIFGSSEYAKEELVAELGSAFILGTLNIGTDDTLTNSTAYIQSWRKRIADDKYLVISASGKAEKACKYILATGAEEMDEEDGE